MATHACAQSPAQPTGQAAATSLTAAGSAPRSPPVTAPPTATTSVTANVTAHVGAPRPASGRTTVTAAGSVIILVDGIVANASIAQIHPPAPGFVYER